MDPWFRIILDMVRCPKCDAGWKAGAKRCPLCGAPLEEASVRPPVRRGEALIDPLLDLFEQVEVVHSCPECRNETQAKRAGCRPCGCGLISSDREEYTRSLVEEPIRSFGDRLAHGPEKVPRDLRLAGVASGFEEAMLWLQEFHQLGLKVWPGSDSLDAFDRPGRLSIFVAGEDFAAARYVTEHVRAIDPWDRPGGAVVPPREQALERATKWRSLGKYRDAARELEPWAGEPLVLARLLEVKLEGGRFREVEELVASALASDLEAAPRAALLAVGALGNSLAADGRPFPKGARLELAAARLAEAVRITPRNLRRGKMRCEVLAVLDQRADLRKELDRLRRLNTNFLATDGFFRTWWDRLRLGGGSD